MYIYVYTGADAPIIHIHAIRVGAQTRVQSGCTDARAQTLSREARGRAPGCAQAIAKESGARFVNIRASSIQSKWLGDTQKLVTALFTLAWKLQPCIIFIGERAPDGAAPRGGGGGGE